MVVIGRRRADRRLPLHPHQRAEGVVAGGRRGGAGVLRVERQEQDALAALALQPPDRRVRRGVAVAHAEIDHHARPVPGLEPLAQLLGLVPGDGQERALVQLLVPDPPVGGARGERPLRQHHELQDRLPDERRVVDHPLVREELGEIAAHRPVVGAVGRAEIDHQHAHLRRRDRRVVGRRLRQPAPARPVHACAIQHRARLPVPGPRGRYAPADRYQRARQFPGLIPVPISAVPSASARRALAEPGRSGSGWSGPGAQPVRNTISKVARTRPSGVP